MFLLSQCTDFNDVELTVECGELTSLPSACRITQQKKTFKCRDFGVGRGTALLLLNLEMQVNLLSIQFLIWQTQLTSLYH